jgi:hypothetical protein
VEIYAAVRRFVLVEGKSRRQAAKVFGLSRDTISKELSVFGAARLCATPPADEAADPETAGVDPESGEISSMAIRLDMMHFDEAIAILAVLSCKIKQPIRLAA